MQAKHLGTGLRSYYISLVVVLVCAPTGMVRNSWYIPVNRNANKTLIHDYASVCTDTLKIKCTLCKKIVVTESDDEYQSEKYGSGHT